MKRSVAVCAAALLVFAACGGGEEEADGPEATVEIDADNDGGNGSDGADNDGGSGGDGDGSSGDSDGSTGPDDDDFGDIVGNPDLDPDDLPGQAGDLADEIDDIVSLGDCVALGLMATPPETMQCRVLDNPGAGGLDGFSMFNPENDFNISLGTPSGIGSPCELLQACGDAMPIELSDNFPDTMILELFGTVTIWGYHATGAELIVTKIGELSDEEIQILMDVLDSVTEA